MTINWDHFCGFLRNNLGHKGLISPPCPPLPQTCLVIVWICSALYCSPKLIFFKAVEHELENHEVEVICLADRKLYSSKTYDTISFFLLYLTPLLLISGFYFKIARYLWLNGALVESRLRQEMASAGPRRSLKMARCSSEQWTAKGSNYFQQVRSFLLIHPTVNMYYGT